MINKICIIGVGLIGGSFALGAKKAHQVKTICGFSRDEENLKKAQELGVIDEYSLDIKTAVKDAQIILIATPVNSFENVLNKIKPYIESKTIITDVGSTKGSVIKIATKVFGKMPTRFIPAHPIAGKEKSGIEAVDENLFNNKRVILTPQDNADKNAIKIISDLWQSIGTKVDIMDYKKHDDILAMTSHLPHMLAFCLMDYLITSHSSARDYAAGGFKDFSRIASSDSVMWRDICLNNAPEIIKHIDGYKQSLDKLKNLIKNNQEKELEKLFFKAKSKRDKWYG